MIDVGSLSTCQHRQEIKVQFIIINYNFTIIINSKTKMKKNILLFIFLLIIVFANAQYKTRKSSMLLFNNSSNQITAGSVSNIVYKVFWAGGIAEYRDSISNDLVFYTQGKTVFDATGNTAINGANLLSGFSATHGATIIPVAPNTFCLITTEQSNSTRFAYYSEINTALVNGVWTVKVNATIKNIQITTPTGINMFASKTTVLKKANGYWLLMHDGTNPNNNLILFKINNGSVVPVYDRTFSLGTKVYSSYNVDFGQMKCSSYDAIGNCKIIAVYGWDYKIDIYNFNYDTGNISLVSTIDIGNILQRPFGCEISPNNQMLYITYNSPQNYISSFDLNAANISSTRLNATIPNVNGNTSFLGGMQLLDDGKIYFPICGKRSMVIIQNPNNTNSINTINMATDVITVSNDLRTCLPNYPRY
jgi:hypothetical protein